MTSFRAFVVDEIDGKYTPGFKTLTLADLPKETVLVDVAFSTLNYKDGLAVTGKGKIARKFPMVCGIDLAGTVAESADPAFKPGDKVLVNGWGLSETFWGGYSPKQRVNPQFLTRLPPAFDFRQAMAIGTAGYTAMLSVLALEDAGVKPGNGDILVTGAVGGVGSVAVALLAKLGYRVVASTGRPKAADYLTLLGATEIIARADLDKIGRPLEKARWAGVVDSVGSKTLGMAIAQTHEEGAVTACGLAGGTDLPTTVMPFILRGVKLLGINSVTCPVARRDQAWARLATDLDLPKLEAMTTVEPLSNIQALGEQILKGETRGRVVIDVNA
ncbi:MAG: oxidoreductase [Alphaproteobacteria bacterium]|nr:oxidoreductase [Alphaproteobacteria bacterium]PHX99320.1 MAG: oxidoreductase [Rhodospirillaceae bacterium]